MGRLTFMRRTTIKIRTLDADVGRPGRHRRLHTVGVGRSGRIDICERIEEIFAAEVRR
ncbi:hypothetical protein [Mycobacterium kansasii]|uniref:hypothetical protein n=1 Tax=Mycobacterium kansasii TaxID=1768 RepID=UPI0015E21BDA|nr:hypothetical protein [Mycobacterium kansasii]